MTKDMARMSQVPPTGLSQATLDRITDSEWQHHAQRAEEVLDRLQKAADRCNKWRRLQDSPIPSEVKLAETELAIAEQEMHDASVQVQQMRGDDLDEPSAQSLPATASAQTNPILPVPRQRAQEAGILEAIRKHGHSPLSLPKSEPGKPGIKAEIRKSVAHGSLWGYGKGKTFDKAWERLRQGGEIADHK